MGFLRAPESEIIASFRPEEGPRFAEECYCYDKSARTCYPRTPDGSGRSDSMYQNDCPTGEPENKMLHVTTERPKTASASQGEVFEEETFDDSRRQAS